MKHRTLLTLLFCLPAFGAGNIGGLWHLDEGSGQLAHDSSTYANDGQLGFSPHVPSWTAGKFGSALHFDGAAFVLVPNSMSLNVTGSITLEAWVKIDANTPASYIAPVISKWEDVGGGDARTYALTILVNSLKQAQLRFDVSHDGLYPSGPAGCSVQNSLQQACPDSAYVMSANFIDFGKWTHVAGVFDSSTKKLQVFINGTPDTSVTAESSSIFTNALALLIGAADFGANRHYFIGTIDEPRLWRRALSPAEVLSSAQAGLRGDWHFDTANGGFTPDSSGDGHDAFLALGAAIAPPARFGAGALSLNGAQYAATSGDGSLNIVGPITVEAWVNLNAFPSKMQSGFQVAFAPIVAKWDDSGSNQKRSFALAVLHDGAVRFDVSHNGQFTCMGLFNNLAGESCADSHSAFISSKHSIQLGSWYHIAGVWDGSTLEVFINGVLDNSISTKGSGIFPQTLPVAFGFANEGHQSSPYFTDGSIDEVHIWSRALSAQEMAFEANNATAAELYLPATIDQEGLLNNGGGNGSGAIDESVLDAGGNKQVTFLEFLVPDAAGAQISGIDGHVSNGNGASLVGWVTGNNALDALINGKTVNPPSLNFQIDLTDKTKLHPAFQWQ